MRSSFAQGLLRVYTTAPPRVCMPLRACCVLCVYAELRAGVRWAKLAWRFGQAGRVWAVRRNQPAVLHCWRLRACLGDIAAL
jgi:hypothetical protein